MERRVERWGIAVAMGAAVVMAGTVAMAATSGPVSSSLSGTTLNTKIWTVQNQDSDLSMTAHPGWLSIGTEEGPAGSMSTAKNVVLQPSNPNANWTISVETSLFNTQFGVNKTSFSGLGKDTGVLQSYQGAALYVWQSGSDWIRVQRQPSNCTLAVQFDPGTWGSSTGVTDANGQPVSSQAFSGATTPQAAQVACTQTDDPLWLRMSKVGDIYTGYYSTNGTTWVELQSYAFPALQASYVGVSANSGGESTSVVDFGFKDFAVTTAATSTTSSATSSTTSSVTSSSASATSSSSASKTSASTSTSTSTASSTVPKTGRGSLQVLLGALLVLVGGMGVQRLRSLPDRR